jgi:hypothetical protein
MPLLAAAPERITQPMTMTQQEQETTATVLRCRYRYATGCDATYDKRTGLYQHEKMAAAHALHRIDLTGCPECGAPCGDETGRSRHLTDEHSIRAGTDARQELDARQVKQIWDAEHQQPPGMAGPEPVTFAAAPASGLSQAPPPNGHSPNGHSPAPVDLAAVQGYFTALVAEVEALRAAPEVLRAEVTDLAAENAELRAENTVLRAEAATFTRVRAILAGQES